MGSIRLKKRVIEKQKTAVLRLGIATAVLLLIGLIAYLSQDRVSPKMDFTNAKVVYDRDEPLSVDMLLEGITAVDNRDGDLTDRIVVKAHYNADASIAVTYCVRDNAGNMTQETRVYNLNGDVASDDPQPTTAPGPTSVPESTSEVENTAESPEEVPTETGEEPPETEEVPTETGVEPPETEEVPTETEPSAPETEPPAPETEPPAPETEPSVPETEPPVPDGSGVPSLQMTAGEAHTPVGVPFEYVNYIAAVSDDLDDAYFLYTHIWIEGWEVFDTNTPGVYPLVFHVEDSNGNMSDGQPLTVYVE